MREMNIAHVALRYLAMNAVEIEAAVSDLAAEQFDAAEFPFQFLAAFDKKETTLKRLRKGDSNKSDVVGGVLLQSSIHLAVCAPGETRAMLQRLKTSPKTAAGKAKFILATDGVVLEAEDLATGETIAPDYPRFAEHIGFFLPLAGISTVREIKDNPIDVRATGRLNKLYIELLKQNPDWGTEARRHDMNHFMARLIFCFFAEDTDIFVSRALFTNTVEQFSESDGSNTHLVLEATFRAMNTKIAERNPDNTPRYAVTFPYVNGGLFAGGTEVPQFTRIARSYLLQAGGLDWQHINPDIFGSMIQAVADDEERGALGMHYTSVPNILKVLNPLLLDDLRAQLAAAGENGRALLNLRRRMSRIRVFDPACGSGNFLVIAYKQMRIIEAEINQRRGEPMLPSEISKKNFRGIEIRDFASEIARLALVIAEYQCDVLHRGPLAAKAEFLPLDEMNWITCGNALRLDWLQVCPPDGTNVKLHSDDLFQTPLDQPEINFDNEGGETFICGNPPYKGSQGQDAMQKDDLREAFHGSGVSHASLDYVSGWFIKATQYLKTTVASAAFVATNSICQGRQVESLWPHVCTKDIAISFAHTSFKWQNLATHNAGVIVVIVGLSKDSTPRKLFASDALKTVEMRVVAHINAYLVPSADTYVEGRQTGIGPRSFMTFGSMANDAGNLLLSKSEADEAVALHGVEREFIRPFVGSSEFIRGTQRHCIWVRASEFHRANKNDWLRARFQANSAARLASPRATTVSLAERGYSFGEVRQTGSEYSAIVVPGVSSESREYLPVGLLSGRSIISNLAFAMFDAPLWNMALIASKLHLVWIATVCGKLKTDYRYSNTLGWNTFPVPPLTDQDKTNLTRCAEDILLARERHFPSTIADLYDPETMPGNLRAAHEANDEALERIYIGRRFKNDTERLEKLFEMYTKLTSQGTGNREQGTARKSKKQVTA
jgi:hypothetical protein